MPTINADLIFLHLLKTGKSVPGEDKVVVAQKPLRRGYDFFWGGYVHDIKYFQEDASPALIYIEAKCWASQKKTTKYSQRIVLERREEPAHVSDDDDDDSAHVASSAGPPHTVKPNLWSVSYGQCTPCVAGQHGGFCQHVFAVLMALEAYGQRTDSTTLPGPQSVTSGRQSWGPRTRNIQAHGVMSSVVERPKPDEERKGGAISCNLYEARGPGVREVSAEDIDTLKASLPEGCRMRGILPSGTDMPRSVQSAFGSCMEGSPISYQLRQGSTLEAPEAVPVPPSLRLHLFPQFPLSRPPCHTLVEKRKPVSFAEARNIQEQSRGQSSSALWLNLHKVKVTASNFHRVARCKDPQLMLPGLFNPPNLDHVPAIVHGRNHEKVAVAAYAKAKFQAGEPVVMKTCGLCMDTDFSFLGASSGRVVFDEKQKSPGLLEVKCPYKHHQKSFEVACRDSSFCSSMSPVDKSLHLKRDHQYFSQVQGQMAICGVEWCDFAIWLGPGLISVERIPLDVDFWTNNLLPKLVTFYHEHAVPYLRLYGKSPQAVPPQPSTASPPVCNPQTVGLRASDPTECFVCHVKDIRILRTCELCQRRYHHMCQVRDESGKRCNDCPPRDDS